MKQKTPIYFELYFVKWSIFIISSFIVGFMLKDYVQNSAIYFGVSINQWDILLNLISNGDFLFFFLFPFVLFNSTQVLLREWSYSVIVRNGNYCQWLLYTLKLFAKGMFLTLLLWVLIGFLLTIGTPYESTWSENAMTEINIYTNTYYYQHLLGLFPFQVYILQITYMSIFFITSHIVSATLFLFNPKMATVITTNIILFLIGLFSLGGRLVDLSFWADLRIYSILIHTYYYANSMLLPILIQIATITVCFLSILFWSKKKTRIYPIQKECKNDFD